jgi:hypothetical protein
VGTVSVVTDEDPERLLAEALRAQATQAPTPQPKGATTSFGGYGLLSGSDMRSPLPQPEDRTERAEEATQQLSVERQVSAGLILLLALLLGLAAGAVVGLLTLI